MAGKELLNFSFSVSLNFIGFPVREPSFWRSSPNLKITDAVSLEYLKKALGSDFIFIMTQASLYILSHMSASVVSSVVLFPSKVSHGC